MRAVFLLVAALVAGCCTAQPAVFPAKPVRFVIGFTPGGPSDILARAVGQKLGERWGQQVVIENRPGAGGNLAAEAVAKSGPDGYTWLLGNNSILATNQSLYRKLPYDPVKDFAPVALVAVQPNILVVHPAVPANSVSELVSYLKANPGTPASAIVGKSGRSAERCAVVTASARSRCAWTYGTTEAEVANISCTRPEITSASAGCAPL